MDKNVEIVYKRFLKREYRNEIRTDKEIDKRNAFCFKSKYKI